MSVNNNIKGPWSKDKIRLYSTDGITLTGGKDARSKKI